MRVVQPSSCASLGAMSDDARASPGPSRPTSTLDELWALVADGDGVGRVDGRRRRRRRRSRRARHGRRRRRRARRAHRPRRRRPGAWRSPGGRRPGRTGLDRRARRPAGGDRQPPARHRDATPRRAPARARWRGTCGRCCSSPGAVVRACADVVRASRRPLDELFAVLADPTRRAVLEHLVHDGPQTATELAAHFPTTRQAVVKHLRVLADAGLVSAERTGARSTTGRRRSAWPTPSPG